jgi:hypothetical protein
MRACRAGVVQDPVGRRHRAGLPRRLPQGPPRPGPAGAAGAHGSRSPSLGCLGWLNSSAASAGSPAQLTQLTQRPQLAQGSENPRAIFSSKAVGLDEGLLQFSLLHSILYGKSIYEIQMAVTNDSAPSSLQHRSASRRSASVRAARARLALARSPRTVAACEKRVYMQALRQGRALSASRQQRAHQPRRAAGISVFFAIKDAVHAARPPRAALPFRTAIRGWMQPASRDHYR